MRASASVRPEACSRPTEVSVLRSVAALPMSIWPAQMSSARPSSDKDRVSPVSACLVATYGVELRRGPGRGPGAVVDDPAAARVLRLHHAEGVLGAQERAGQVGLHDIHP